MIKRWQNIAKKYGCAFENIEFVEEEGGIKGVAIDKNKKIKLKVCKPVIVKKDDIVIEDNFHYVKGDKDKELKNMLNEYLDFIFSDERVEELKDKFANLNALPKEIKNILEKFNVEFFDDLSKKNLKKMLLDARIIENRKVDEIWFMPFIDFLNHSFDSTNFYEASKNCIKVEGEASKSGEVFACYNFGDAFSFFNKYHFFCRSPFAYSASFSFSFNESNFFILRNIFQFEKKDYMKIPLAEKQNNIDIFSMVWVGSEYTPRQPFWSFKYLFENKLGRKDFVTIYSQIKSLNIKMLTQLLEMLDKLKYENQTVKSLKQVAFSQLDVIASSFEDL